MDEFESISTKTQKGNKIHFSKSIIIILGPFTFLTIAVVAGYIFFQTSQDGNGAPTATHLPDNEPTPTAQAVREIPEEFAKIEEKINALQTKFAQTPTQRTQMTIPSMNITTNLTE